MAILGKWSANSVTVGDAPEAWGTAPAIFGTEDRNDSAAYSMTSTGLLTLPSSGLADGYLLIAAAEFFDDGARYNPQLRITQASGTGDFVGGPTGGYLRDPSEDRAYVRCWAFVNNPSVSSTYQTQWKADTDDADAADTTERSEFQVIPLFYSNHGIYSSTSSSLYGGTTPNQVTGWGVVGESDTAAIELVSNVVTLKTDNKRYLSLGSQFFEGRGGRTQRWHGFEIDGSFANHAKAYSYYRNGANDESGDLFTWLINRITTDVTLEQNCYLGDGIAASQGGADADGSTPAVGDHTAVVLELNDSAEVFYSNSNANSANLATAGPIDLSLFPTANFNSDSASFTRVSDSAVNVEVATDVLFGANVSAAQNTILTGSRWTAFAEVTKNGVEEPDSFAGDYMRSNQGSTDTFGWSANLLGFLDFTVGQDIGFSVTEHIGSEGGGGSIDSNSGWAGAWGINLDTLAEASDTPISAEVGTYTLTGADANTEQHHAVNAEPGTYSLIGEDATTEYIVSIILAAEVGSYSLTGTASGTLLDQVLSAEVGSYSLSGVDAGTDYASCSFDDLAFDTEAFDVNSFAICISAAATTITAEVGTYSLTGSDANTEHDQALFAEVGTYSLTGLDANTEHSQVLTAEVGTYNLTGADAATEYSRVIAAGVGSYSLSGVDASTEYDQIVSAETATYTLVGVDAATTYAQVLVAESGSYTLTGVDAGTIYDPVLSAEVGSYSLTGQDAETLLDSLLTAETGTYSLIGEDANTVYGSDTSLNAETGSYSLTGIDANTEYDRIISAEAGSYSLTGTDAATQFAQILSAETGSYSLTGSDAQTLKGSVLSAEVGSYSLSGVDAGTDYARVLQAGTGAYTLVGQDVTTQIALNLIAGTGAYSLSGVAVGFLYDRILSAETGAYVLTGADASTTYFVPQIHGLAPLIRTIYIKPEDRALITNQEDRLLTIPTENRTFGIQEEDRTIKLKPNPRQLRQ